MTEQPDERLGTSPVMTRRNRRSSAFPPSVLLVIFLILAAVVVAGWLWLRPEDEGGPGVTTATDSLPPLAREETLALPPLDASDEVVRRLAAAVASHPRLAQWLVTDDLIRRFVRAVVDVSRGSSPVPALDMLIPDAPYTVLQADDRILVDPATYRRYDALAEVMTSVDVSAATELHWRLLPLFREAYREMGVPDGDFEEVLARAIQNLLAVDVPQGPLELREAVGRYVYADPRMESLTPAEKHLLRMGPENAREVQEKVRAIARELGLIPADLDPGGP